MVEARPDNCVISRFKPFTSPHSLYLVCLVYIEALLLRGASSEHASLAQRDRVHIYLFLKCLFAPSHRVQVFLQSLACLSHAALQPPATHARHTVGYNDRMLTSFLHTINFCVFLTLEYLYLISKHTMYAHSLI